MEATSIYSLTLHALGIQPWIRKQLKVIIHMFQKKVIIRENINNQQVIMSNVPVIYMTFNLFKIFHFRNNLHIVLCMSPVGNAFRARCRMFPSLVNCCTIDWFTEWPREALLGVSQSFFETVDLGGSDELKVKRTAFF